MYGNSYGRPKPLFMTGDGMQAVQGQIAAAGKAVDALSEKDLTTTSDDDIVAKIVGRLNIIVPTLKRDDISYEREVKKVRVENRWDGGTTEREVTIFNFEIPYDGEDDIFKLRPDHYDSAPPYGEASRGVLKIAVQDEGDAARIQQSVNDTLNSIERYLAWHRPMWAGLSQSIERETRQRLVQRHQKIAQSQSTEAGLAGFGFKPKT